MAIARDTFAQNQVADGTATCTASITPAGSDRIMLIGIINQNTGSITSVTFNGVAATLIDSQTSGASTTYMYYLIAPDATTANVSVTRGTTTNFMFVYAYTFTGAKQSAQPDGSNKGTASAVTSITGTVTTTADNCWCVMVAYADNAGMAPSTNSTEVSTPYGPYDAFIFMDNRTIAPITPAGSTTMKFTGTSGNLSYVMASVSPALPDTSAFFSIL